jgi:hypothetical protein
MTEEKPLTLREQVERQRAQGIARMSLHPPPISSEPSGVKWTHKDGKKQGYCTHAFGLAGGFSECSACGTRRS